MYRRLFQTRIGAFTLVELLMVIAIIALLAGLLLPTLGRSKEKGRQMSSIANAGQIVKAIYMYATDHRNKLPDWGAPTDLRISSGGDEDGGPINENQVLYEYIKDPRVFRSPSDKGTTWGPLSGDHCFIQHGTSYGYAASDYRGIRGLTPGAKIYTYTNTSKKVAVFEAPMATDQSDKQDQWYSTGEGGVVGFLDGHADMVMSNAPTPDSNNPYY